MSFFDVTRNARQNLASVEDFPTITPLTDEDLIHVTGAWGEQKNPPDHDHHHRHRHRRHHRRHERDER